MKKQTMKIINKQKENDKEFLRKWEELGKPKRFKFEVELIYKRIKDNYETKALKENIKGLNF